MSKEEFMRKEITQEMTHAVWAEIMHFYGDSISDKGAKQIVQAVLDAASLGTKHPLA
jgi:hypothetical protein